MGRSSCSTRRPLCRPWSPPLLDAPRCVPFLWRQRHDHGWTGGDDCVKNDGCGADSPLDLLWKVLHACYLRRCPMEDRQQVASAGGDHGNEERPMEIHVRACLTHISLEYLPPRQEETEDRKRALGPRYSSRQRSPLR